MQRFAVYQEATDKWRTLDNGRVSSHNEMVAAAERIHTTSTNASVEGL